MKTLGHKIIGEGSKTIIVLHELMGDNRNYDAILPYLDTKDFKYIFTDLRGYGLSKELKGEYSCDEAAYDIQDLITLLNLEDVTILAHSMSTQIAQMAVLLEDKIKQLILVTPISPAGIKMTKNSADALIQELQDDDGKIEDIVRSASKRYNQKWIDYRIETAYDSSLLEARVGYMKMYLETDFLYEIRNKDIPIKIIVGKYDFPIFSKENVSKVFNSIYNDVEIVECQEAGHYPMIECPAFFATKLEKFFK